MKISQREARRLRKQNNELLNTLESLKRTWGRDYPGTHILTLDYNDTVGKEDLSTIRTARRLEHPVVVTEDGNKLHFYGLRP